MKAQPAFLLISLALIALPLWAQDRDEQVRLEKLEREMADRRALLADLRKQADIARTAIDQFTAQMVDLAGEAQKLEGEANRLEGRIADLRQRLGERRDRLIARRDDMVATLAALERMSRQPPELTFIRPQSAIDTLRSAAILAAILPEIEAQARDIRDQVRAIESDKADLEADRQTLGRELSRLDDKRDEIDRLRAERESERSRLLAGAADEGERIEALSAEAKSIRELLAKLAEERSKRADAALDAARRLGASQATSAVIAAVPDTGIAKRKGRLALPAVGRMIEAYGAELGFGSAKGITIATRARAQVVAPHDGRIIYAGDAPSRRRGQVLIIDHGDKYLTVLAGIDAVFARTGQWVLAGEPVGVMATSGNDDPSPELYVELRVDGQPIDPLPWLTSGLAKVS